MYWKFKDGLAWNYDEMILCLVSKCWYMTFRYQHNIMRGRILSCWSTFILKDQNFSCQGEAELWQEIELLRPPQGCHTSFEPWWEPIPIISISIFQFFFLWNFNDLPHFLHIPAIASSLPIIAIWIFQNSTF